MGEIRHIHVNGAGNRFCAYLGAWTVFEDHFSRLAARSWQEQVKSLESFSGSSAGTVVALAMCVGLSCEETRAIVDPIVQDPRIATADPDVKRLADSFGIFSGNNLRAVVHKVLDAAGLSRETTFARLARLLGKRYAVKVTNLSTSLTEIMDDVGTPDVRIDDAAVASMSIPCSSSPCASATTCTRTGTSARASRAAACERDLRVVHSRGGSQRHSDVERIRGRHDSRLLGVRERLLRLPSFRYTSTSVSGPTLDPGVTCSRRRILASSSHSGARPRFAS